MSCFVPRDRNTGNPRGFAFVEMVNEEEGQAAIAALDGADIDGRTIRVNKQVSKEELAKTRKPREERPVVEGKRIYVGNLPFDIERHELVSMFEDYGTVLESFLPFDKETGKPRGFAFVTMADAEADAAIEALNYCTFGGRTLNVNESLPRGQPAEPKPMGKRTKIYVGNLNFATREQDIVSVFAEYGQILDCFFPTDRETGQYRGFCFVTMPEDAAQKAIEGVDGVELDGRLLRVNEALPKNQPGASAPSDDFEADAGFEDDDSADYES
jgi:nucleolin